jgi:hypothetical protein
MSLALPNQLPKPAELDPEDRVFRHKKRPDWGVGVWVREESSRRRLRFEDGQMRAFKEGFYQMLVPVDSEKIDVDEVFERVMGEHEDATTLADVKLDDPVMPFAKQVEVFLHLFPDGFAGDAYQSTWGDEATKSHRLAQSSAAFREALGKELTDANEAAERFVAALDDTTLVGPSAVRSVAALKGDDKEKLGVAVLQLLHGEHRFSRRFTAWLDALRELGLQPKWRLTTAPLGLYHPKKHIVVRRQVLHLQARSVHPAKVPSKPNLAGYRRARRTARGVRDKLVALGMKPASMLDVHAFVWETLRPKAQKLVKTL